MEIVISGLVSRRQHGNPLRVQLQKLAGIINPHSPCEVGRVSIFSSILLIRLLRLKEVK